MNSCLKAKIFVEGYTQLQVARQAGVSDSYLSKVIRGWIDPPPEIKARLAAILECDVKELFPKDGRPEVPAVFLCIIFLWFSSIRDHSMQQVFPRTR